MFDPVKIFLTALIMNMITDGTMGIAWKNCSDESLRAANAKCGFVSVPLNYKRPQGRKLQIAVARILHTSSEAKYQGVMLVRQGGSDGLITVLRRQSFPDSVAATYDWIAFDQRGIGVSGPNLSCIPDFYPAPPVSLVPTTEAIEELWLNRSKRYIAACVKKHGSILPHISSLNMARDMERIRIAIGANKFHIYSASFGTYLVQLYATLYSNRVGRMVMDSLWNTQRLRYQRILDTNIGIQRVLDVWLDWVAEHDNVYHLGNRSCEVRKLWNDALERVAKDPIGGWIGPLEWSDILTQFQANTNYWTFLTPILGAYMKDNNDTLITEIFTRGTDEDVAFTLINTCNDEQWPQNWNKVKTDFWRSYAQAPLYSWSQGWYNIPCIYWPYKVAEPVNVDGSGIGDVLLIFETRALGYREENVMYVRDIFPSARYVSIEDGLGSSTALMGNKCVDDIVIAYVRNGTIPARRAGEVADVVCASPPLPIP